MNRSVSPVSRDDAAVVRARDRLQRPRRRRADGDDAAVARRARG